ncbi:hypothetical protein ACTXG6_06930 [Pseudonocardia sp. Cha107L01]|uniref:hypothetical protein n=1 Tax=Pseudonocardia sp. Cha107L01 TaxID=3457576 RepID=UPI00403E9209
MAHPRTRHPWTGQILVGVLLGCLCLVSTGVAARAPGIRTVGYGTSTGRSSREPVVVSAQQPTRRGRGPRPAPGPTPPSATTDPAAPTTDPAAPTTAAAPTTDPTAPTTDPAAAAPTTPLAPPPAADAAVNQNCTLAVPPAPLTAVGLATPYRLTATDGAAGACHEANANQSAFVEAAILDPGTGKISIYHPLVIDDGTQPAAAPVRPTLPPRASVAVWFGFQANTLSLRAKRFNRHRLLLRFLGGNGNQCVNGTANSPFGQFAYCNAPAFFAAAKAAIRAGSLRVPALGTARDGQPCPSTRDFSVVDQDQSDNLDTKYLALPDGRTAQFSPANQSQLAGATVLTNASDNGLLDRFIDPALGCQPFTAPDISGGNSLTPALALNELQAAAGQRAPVALVPPNDPMAQVNGQNNTAKTNLYRAGVNMGPAAAADTGAAYCTNLGKVAPARLAGAQQFLANATSPDPAAGATLFDFLTQRLTASWTNLNCQGLTGQGPPAVGTNTAAAVAVAPSDTPAANAPATTGPTTTDPTTADPTTTTPTTTDPAATDPAADPTITNPTTTDPATGTTPDAGAPATGPAPLVGEANPPVDAVAPVVNGPTPSGVPGPVPTPQCRPRTAHDPVTGTARTRQNARTPACAGPG